MQINTNQLIQSLLRPRSYITGIGIFHYMYSRRVLGSTYYIKHFPFIFKSYTVQSIYNTKYIEDISILIVYTQKKIYVEIPKTYFIIRNRYIGNTYFKMLLI